MSQKFGWAIGTAVTGWLLSYFGFQANAEQSAETIQGIKMFLSWLPGAAAFVSMLFVIGYPLGEQKMKEIIGKLNLCHLCAKIVNCKMVNINTLRNEMRSELENNILPFWMNKMEDNEQGGFYGEINPNT